MMLNPEIIKKDGAYDTEEVCLSLLGGSRKCKCNFSEANAPEQSGAFVYAERCRVMSGELSVPAGFYIPHINMRKRAVYAILCGR